MKRKHFEKLQVGDVVVITSRGRNRGKKGIVKEVVHDKYHLGLAYLEPLDCTFEVCEGRGLRNTEGYYGWNCISIKHVVEPVDKEFYVARMFGEDGIKWSADHYTEHELGIINKFLEEFNERANGTYVDGIVILDCED